MDFVQGVDEVREALLTATLSELREQDRAMRQLQTIVRHT
ncbi:hypothetical protein QF026_008207 [Streptomyces aurantiacus]|nr:hypothetical protein [Streptomyces aurantiacus]